MTGAHILPLSAAILVSALLLIGAALALIGAIGTLRLKSFFERMHAPAIGVSGGAGAILLASMIYFSLTEQRLVIHEIVIGLFLMITAPVTAILLGRAALYRERSEEENQNVPSMSAVMERGRKAETE